jgi:spoIIIJ-associated protein
MSEFRTFSGKTVDEAMEEACRQLGSPREKLEIEILSGGSSGIFGLVGKKKAEVRARIREEINLLQDMPGQGQAAASGGRAEHPSRQAPRPAKPKSKPEPAKVAPQPAPIPEPASATLTVPAPEVLAETRPAPQIEDVPAIPDADPADAAAPCDVDEAFEDADDQEADEACDVPPVSPAPSRRDGRSREERPAAPQIPAAPMTPELEALVREVMEKMLDGILGQIPEFEISGDSERVAVLVRDEDNSGLLIGREGQTLSSIQYLVNRIVIRRHGSPVKVQINTGEYRERQDDNLRKMAIFLADKAKSLGRPQSTKPLSSYHRRVVHLALQEDEAISTRSKGDGPLKRVLIVPRARSGESHNNGQRS